MTAAGRILSLCVLCMADPLGHDELINALNYLGTNVSIPITSSGLPVSAAAGGAIPAPSPAAAGQAAPQITGPSGTPQGLSGGGLVPQGTGAQAFAGAGDSLTRLASQLFGGGSSTRGETGGVSLSDQLRSTGGGLTTA